MRRRVGAGRRALGGRSVVTLACALWGCEPTASPELVAAAKTVHSAEAASAAVVAAKPTPLGAAPSLVEEAFREGRPSSFGSPAKVSSCALDLVDDAPIGDVATIKEDENVRLVGWAADGATGSVPPVVVVELARPKKAFYVRARRVTKRPDVATASKVEAFVDSGYDVLSNFQIVEAGEYSVTVLQVNDAGNALACDTRKKLKVE